MGKGTGAVAAHCLASDSPEGKALVQVLRCQTVQNSEPVNDGVTVYDAVDAPLVAISDYLVRWCTYAQQETRIFIIASIYIDRFLMLQKLDLTVHNIHRIVLAALVVAAKLHDDAPFTNMYYAEVGGMSVTEMNRIERHFLFDVGFHLFVTPDEFTEKKDYLTGVYSKRQALSGKGKLVKPPRHGASMTPP